MAFSALENAAPSFSDAVVKVAWIAFITTLFVRLRPDTPAPMESFVKWYNGK